MFTGIVEEVGAIKNIKRGQHSAVLTIQAKTVLEGTRIGDSIAVNGICLTVTRLFPDGFSADVMHETLNRSSLAGLTAGSVVNLERAMPANGRFGGHIVAGHVDGVGHIANIRRDDTAVWYTVHAGPEILRYVVEKGSITIDGVDVRHIKREELRRNIAVVLQDTHLFTGTVMENIQYGRLDASDEEVIQAAKTASAHSFIMRLPKGYDTVLESDGANLSQGQRQLLNIARAAVSRAPILILDEATSSVDTRTEKHIERGMDRLMADRTTFVIAHRLSTVRNANAIMVLENGEIIERGDHDDLLAQKGRYYSLYTGRAELE